MVQRIIEWVEKVFSWLEGAMKEEKKSQEQLEKDVIEGLIFVGVVGVIIVVGSCIYWLIVGYFPSVPEVQQDMGRIIFSDSPAEVEQEVFDSASGQRIKRLAIYAGVVVGVVGVIFLGVYIFGK